MSQFDTNNNWRRMFINTMKNGTEIEVRGSRIKEIEGQALTVDPMWPFITFEARNYNMDYCKKELQWKVQADKYDDRIENHATMWASVKNKDGSFNSNYGDYWFADGGVERAVEQLLKDKHSRRACIPMLKAEHTELDVNDTVCTEAMTFLIRGDRLNCHAHMRSSDQVFGLGTDIPSFSFVMRLVLGFIQAKYPEVQMGKLTIVAASSHIYDHHYDLFDKLDQQKPPVKPMSNDFWMPLCGFDEARYLCTRRYSGIMSHEAAWPLTQWLISGGRL